ncbi:MAG: MerR family transcriptional regulator [Pleomorphochaeta sp.]
MTYSISQVAKKFNLTIHTIRYYEKEGVLPFIKRTKSGIREFDQKSLDALNMIECLKKTGMSLKDIKVFQDWCAEGDSSIEKRKEMFEERKEDILGQISELQHVLKLIEFKCWYYGKASELGSEKAVMELEKDKIPDEIKKLYQETHDY